MLEIGKEYWIYNTKIVDLKYENTLIYPPINPEYVEVCSFIAKIKIIKINKRSYTVEINGKKENLQFESTYYNDQGKFDKYIRYIPEKIYGYEILKDLSILDKKLSEYQNFLKFDSFGEVNRNNSRIERYKNEIVEVEKKIDELLFEKRRYEEWISAREKDNLEKYKKAEEAAMFFRENK